jgi:hypothetical protein
MLAELRSVLTTGRLTRSEGISCSGFNGLRALVGSNHGTAATGYVTIDVVATCSNTTPGDPRYFTSDLLYDNVLTGDWIAVSPGAADNYASASSLVHIRAVPEGGRAGTRVPRVLPYTFYGRLLANRPLSERVADRRQPLPSAFAARFIQGGTDDFQTRFTIWREAITGPNALCAAYVQNSNLPIADLVRFDEHENATILSSGILGPPPVPGDPGLPVSSTTSSASSTFPTLVSPHNGIAGWLYLNLGRYSNSGKTTIPGAGQEQAWVTITMYAERRYAAAFEAVALQNGCSPVPSHDHDSQIGPE